jgi:hypothetical protein
VFQPHAQRFNASTLQHFDCFRHLRSSGIPSPGRVHRAGPLARVQGKVAGAKPPVRKYAAAEYARACCPASGPTDFARRRNPNGRGTRPSISGSAWPARRDYTAKGYASSAASRPEDFPATSAVENGSASASGAKSGASRASAAVARGDHNCSLAWSRLSGPGFPAADVERTAARSGRRGGCRRESANQTPDTPGFANRDCAPRNFRAAAEPAAERPNERGLSARIRHRRRAKSRSGRRLFQPRRFRRQAASQ